MLDGRLRGNALCIHGLHAVMSNSNALAQPNQFVPNINVEQRDEGKKPVQLARH